MIFQLPEYIVADTQVVYIFHRKLCTELFIFRETPTRIFLQKDSLNAFEIPVLIDLLCKCGKCLVHRVRRNATDHSTKHITLNELEDGDEVFPREQLMFVVV